MSINNQIYPQHVSVLGDKCFKVQPDAIFILVPDEMISYAALQ